MADYTMTWVLLALYLVGLLALLVFVVSQNLRGQIQGAVERHYLADRSLGGLTLGLTAIASIFSGYTVTGLPAEAWRTGFSALRWYGYGPTIVLTFVALAPRLRHLASRRGYVSVLDLVRDRYCKGGVDPLGRLLHALATCTFLVPCAIYLLVQFISFSANINVLAKGEWPAWLPGLFLFLLLVVFETAGGLKAVVLTDVVQGGVLAVAALAWIFIQGEVFGGMQSATAALVEEKPSLVDAPPAASMGGWLNAWVLVGVGRVMFPDLMTRMAAARRHREQHRQQRTIHG